MADKKISQLTGATTPLAGTEVLPIVQSGATVKVANNDLRPKQIQSNSTSGVLQVTGPAAAATRVMTVPDANFTAARTDAAQSFTGLQTFASLGITNSTAGLLRTTINASNAAAQQVDIAFTNSGGTSYFGQDAAGNAFIDARGTLANANIGYSGAVVAGFNASGLNMASGYSINGANYLTLVATSGNSVICKVGSTTIGSFDSTGNLTVNNGNLVVGTAGKGIDFSANSHAAGMTSELLTWYEEGTWTPTDNSGDGLTLTGTYCTYTRIGRLVTVSGFVSYPSTASGSAASISGLPFTSKNAQQSAASFFNNASLGIYGFIDISAAYILLRDNTNSNITNANLSGKFVCFSFAYTV